MDKMYEIPLEIIHAFNNSDEPRGIKDTASRFIFLNDVHRELLGLDSIEQIIGKSYDEVELPYVGLAERSRQHEIMVMETRKLIRSLEIFPFAAGDFVAYIFERAPFFNKQGEVIGTAFMGREVKKYLPLEFITKLPVGTTSIFDFEDPLQELSEREFEIIFLLCKGFNRASVAKKLGISEDWTKKCIKTVYDRLDVHSVEELTNYALTKGWLTTIPKRLLTEYMGYFIINS
ncbi:TPA: PAS domain-containing protein [Klebsiella aerogenes]